MSNALAIRIVRKVSAVPRETWDGLLGGGSPFMKWDWLDSFEQTGCVSEETGWLPHHLVVEKGDRLLLSVPYISNSTVWESSFLTGNGRRRPTGPVSNTTQRCWWACRLLRSPDCVFSRHRMKTGNLSFVSWVRRSRRWLRTIKSLQFMSTFAWSRKEKLWKRSGFLRGPVSSFTGRIRIFTRSTTIWEAFAVIDGTR